MKKPKVLIRTFSEAELKRLSNYYQGYTYLQLPNRVMLLLLIDTGIRMSELIGLTEEQLKYDYILICGKGNKERVVPKSPTLSKWLLKFLTVRKSYFAYQIVPNNIFLSRKHRLTRAHREKQLKMSCQALHNAPPNRT